MVKLKTRIVIICLTGMLSVAAKANDSAVNSNAGAMKDDRIRLSGVSSDNPSGAASELGSSANWNLSSFLYKSVEQSDSVAVQDLQRGRAEAVVSESKSAFLPTLNGSVAATRTGGAIGNGAVVNGQVITNSTESTTLNSRVTLTQNLFNGLQDRAKLKSSQAASNQQKYQLIETKRAQIESSLKTFFGLLEDQSDLLNEQREVELNEKNLNDTRHRIRIGSARATEAINLEATIATNHVDIVTTQASLSQNIESAKRLLRLDADSVKLEYQPGKFNPHEIKKVLASLDPQERADLKAQNANTEAVKQTLNATDALNIPKLDFSGTYIITDSQPMSQAGQYSLGITLTIPMPFGMEKRAQTEEARKDFQVAQRQQELKKRDLELDRQQLIRTLESNVDTIDRLDAAKKISARNVDALKKDRGTGLSSYTEVLAASSTYQQIVRKYDRAILEFELNCFRALIWSTGDKDFSLVLGGK